MAPENVVTPVVVPMGFATLTFAAPPAMIAETFTVPALAMASGDVGVSKFVPGLPAMVSVAPLETEMLLPVPPPVLTSMLSVLAPAVQVNGVSVALLAGSEMAVTMFPAVVPALIV